MFTTDDGRTDGRRTPDASIYYKLTYLKSDEIARFRQIGSSFIRLTCPCNVETLTPQFYIVKLGFSGVNIIFFALCFEQKYENSKNKNQQKIVIFTSVKNRCILHGRVFVMKRV